MLTSLHQCSTSWGGVVLLFMAFCLPYSRSLSCPTHEGCSWSGWSIRQAWWSFGKNEPCHILFLLFPGLGACTVQWAVARLHITSQHTNSVAVTGTFFHQRKKKKIACSCMHTAPFTIAKALLLTTAAWSVHCSSRKLCIFFLLLHYTHLSIIYCTQH